jgi:hypothetical protein
MFPCLPQIPQSHKVAARDSTPQGVETWLAPAGVISVLAALAPFLLSVKPPKLMSPRVAAIAPLKWPGSV